jgi:hypothetical protein
MDSNTTMEITNDKLEEAIKTYAADHSTENLRNVLNLLRPTRLLVPAMLKGPNQPTPCFLKSSNGEQFLAVYTSKEQIPAEPKSQAILSMPFVSCNEIVAKPNLNISGMVINPFSDNLVLKRELVEKLHEADQKTAQVKQVKMTPAQYAVFVKKQLEFGVLPKRLFTEKATFVDRICEERETFVNAIFEEGFREKKLYPYQESDFSVMALEIGEDLTLIRIDLPERDMAVGLCYRVYVTYDPLTQKACYFTIEMTKEKDVHTLGRIGEDGKRVDYGEAPVEGAELQAIIDIARNSEAASGLTS